MKQAAKDRRLVKAWNKARGRFSGCAYRFIMRIAHKYNWHYAPPIYPEGDTQLWCKWCGFRETIHRRNSDGIKGVYATGKARVL